MTDVQEQMQREMNIAQVEKAVKVEQKRRVSQTPGSMEAAAAAISEGGADSVPVVDEAHRGLANAVVVCTPTYHFHILSIISSKDRL